MIDSVRAGFTALGARTPKPGGELAVLRLDDLRGAVLGLDDSGRPHLLLEAPGGEAPSSDVATLDIAMRSLVIGDSSSQYVDVTCLFEAVAEVFDHFVVAVLDRMGTAGMSAVVAVTDVLERWRQFLVPAAQPPGRDRLAAVLGELLMVLDVVRTSPAGGVGAWVGPFGARHDLRRGCTAVEVKTTRSHTTRMVTIHGEDQLLAPDGATLHLHLVRLEEAPDAGRSVASLVDELLLAGAPAEQLFDALAAAGVPAADLPATATVAFGVRERLTFVVDETMPRIVPQSFAAGERPAGIIDITYRIDLDHCLDHVIESQAYEAVVSGLAGHGSA